MIINERNSQMTPFALRLCSHLIRIWNGLSVMADGGGDKTPFCHALLWAAAGKKKSKGKKKVKKQPSRPLSPVYIEVQVWARTYSWNYTIKLDSHSSAAVFFCRPPLIHIMTRMNEINRTPPPFLYRTSENNPVICENTNNTLFLRNIAAVKYRSKYEICVFDKEIDS